MKKPSKTEKTKAWRIEKTGNATVAIYRRDKFHKPSGKTYQVYEVADYTTGARRLQSFSDSAEAIHGGNVRSAATGQRSRQLWPRRGAIARRGAGHAA